jgi:hypothetical protein
MMLRLNSNRHPGSTGTMPYIKQHSTVAVEDVHAGRLTGQLLAGRDSISNARHTWSWGLMDHKTCLTAW